MSSPDISSAERAAVAAVMETSHLSIGQEIQKFERAIPIFVDVDPQTGNLNPKLGRAAVTDLRAGGTAAQRWLTRQGISGDCHLKALLPVDVFGQPADMDPLIDIARLCYRPPLRLCLPHEHNQRLIVTFFSGFGPHPHTHP